jgi:succinate dehydrogenase hydrophobic anchor subunit
MSTSVAVWLLIGLAMLAANLPWLSERFLFVFEPQGGYKRVWMRLLEWLLLALLVGLMALGLERTATGGVHEQGWEFYVVGLFLVFYILLADFPIGAGDKGGGKILFFFLQLGGYGPVFFRHESFNFFFSVYDHFHSNRLNPSCT